MGRMAIVLQARMKSTRLPGKVLADLAGRPLLVHCVERLRAASDLPVVLATTTNPEDDCLEEQGERLGVTVVRGPECDVLARYVLAATTLGLTELVRATADNPAVDIDAPRRTLDLLVRTHADHVGERGLPYGAAVEAVTADALVRAADIATDPYDREHVTPLIKRDRRFFALEAIAPGRLRRPSLRVTVDTQDDLQFMRRLITLAEEETVRPVPLEYLIGAADRLHDRAADGGEPGIRGAR